MKYGFYSTLLLLLLLFICFIFSTLKDKSLFKTKPNTIFYEQLSASTPLTNTTTNTTTTTPTTPTTPTRPIDNKNASIILASNPEDVHNFDTLTTYLTPSPSPTDPHKLTPSGFFRLLHAFLLHLPSNQQKFYDVIGPVTIAALLQKLHARMMGIGQLLLLFTSLFVCLFVCLFTCLFTCLFVCLFVCL